MSIGLINNNKGVSKNGRNNYHNNKDNMGKYKFTKSKSVKHTSEHKRGR